MGKVDFSIRIKGTMIMDEEEDEPNCYQKLKNQINRLRGIKEKDKTIHENLEEIIDAEN